MQCGGTDSSRRGGRGPRRARKCSCREFCHKTNSYHPGGGMFRLGFFLENKKSGRRFQDAGGVQSWMRALQWGGTYGAGWVEPAMKRRGCWGEVRDGLGFLAWLSTYGATLPASHWKRESRGREHSLGPQTLHGGHCTDGRWGLRKADNRAAGAKWGKGDRKRVGRGAQIRKGTERAGCRAGQRCRTSVATRHQGQPGGRTAAHRESPASARARGGTFSPGLGFLPNVLFPRVAQGLCANSELAMFAFGAAGTEVSQILRTPGAQPSSSHNRWNTEHQTPAWSTEPARWETASGPRSDRDARSRARFTSPSCSEEQTARPLPTVVLHKRRSTFYSSIVDLLVLVAKWLSYPYIKLPILFQILFSYGLLY